MNKNLLNPDYVICLCHKKTVKEVVEAIKKDHITDLRELCETIPIGNKCGGCREELEELLNLQISNS